MASNNLIHSVLLVISWLKAFIEAYPGMQPGQRAVHVRRELVVAHTNTWIGYPLSVAIVRADKFLVIR